MDATLISSILVPVCGVLSTVLAAKIAGDKREVEEAAKSASTYAAQLQEKNALLEIARLYITDLQVELKKSGGIVPPYPDELKRLRKP